jgi:hypothetical protein
MQYVSVRLDSISGLIYSAKLGGNNFEEIRGNSKLILANTTCVRKTHFCFLLLFLLIFRRKPYENKKLKQTARGRSNEIYRFLYFLISLPKFNNNNNNNNKNKNNSNINT